MRLEEARDQGAIRVWDPFVRVFHWGTVALVATAFLTPDEKWLHEPAGYVILALAAARVLWGLVGTRHARFSDFIAGPRTVAEYLRRLWQGRAPRYLGHNPAGGAMVAVLLLVLLIVAGSGWLSETDAYFGVPWVDHLHHISADLLLVLIGFHLLGVLVSSFLHRENLVRAMVTGRKPRSAGRPERQHEGGPAAIPGGGFD